MKEAAVYKRPLLFIELLEDFFASGIREPLVRNICYNFLNIYFKKLIVDIAVNMRKLIKNALWNYRWFRISIPTKLIVNISADILLVNTCLRLTNFIGINIPKTGTIRCKYLVNQHQRIRTIFILQKAKL